MSKKNAPRILLWDIEASNLVADYGRILCIGFKWLGERKTHLLRIRDTVEFKRDVTDDRGLLRAFRKVFESADQQVTWYGKGFDVPFVQTRMMMSGLAPLAQVPHVDGWWIARKRLKFRSNRLAGVSQAIPVARESERKSKTPISPDQWVRGQAGHVPSLKYIEAHCVADVQVLEDVYLALRPFGSAMPDVSQMGKLPGKLNDKLGCPSCGSRHMQLKGFYVTATSKERRVQCQGCGHGIRLSLSRAKKLGVV